MATEPLIRRAHPHSPWMSAGRTDRLLGHPVAFLITVGVLVVVFGWTFFTNPGRPAAADDPAYYTWRTEALLANDPKTLLEIDGPLDMYSGGYRVATPVLGGLMRRIAGVASLTPTIVLSVGLRVLVPLLLAGFAYRSRGDPLVWHAVAFLTASLLLTPPFGGYLDNVLTLFFLSASLYLLGPMRTSWGPRAAFFVLLLVSGFTHPTTLAIFCLTLGVMAVARFVFRGFSLRSALLHDGAMLVTALAAAIATYALWKVGIWGVTASLSEAAVPPPAGADFFRIRLNDWLGAMRPPVNGTLFVIGLVGLLAAGRRAAEDELTRVSIAWLAPLVGIFGVFAGVAYPYYRFFNTTTAWLLLIGIGSFFVVRYCIDVARRGGVGLVALVGLVAIAYVVVSNFDGGLTRSGWNDVSDAWMKPDEQEDLGLLRSALESEQPDSVVFVVDDDVDEPVRIYGFAKRTGNVSRFGVPAELQDRSAFYLGSLSSYLENEPTEKDDYYADLSRASLEDANAVAGRDPDVVVVAQVFNRTGRNADFDRARTEGKVWYVAGCEAHGLTGCVEGLGGGGGIPVTAVLGGLLLLVPGGLLLRWSLPGAGFTDAVALVPALSSALLILVGIGALAIARSPLTGGVAWTIVIVSGVLSLVGLGASFFSGQATRGYLRSAVGS